MSRADSELPWFYGSGPSSLAGDSGLRSSLGSQLDALRASKTKRGGGILESRSVDSSKVEDGMIDRLGAVFTASEIRLRLNKLSLTQREALRLHYSGRSLPYGIDPAACLLARARRLCNVPDGVTLVAPELVRAALMAGCPEDERERLTAETDALVSGSRDAYDNLRMDADERGRRPQIDDPRPWKR